MENLSKIKSALRTKDKPFGNFGRAKVKAGSPLRDIGVTDAEVVRVTSRQSYIDRLYAAYDKTSDVSMKRFVLDELRRLGCFKEKRLEPVRPEPYRPIGT